MKSKLSLTSALGGVFLGMNKEQILHFYNPKYRKQRQRNKRVE